MLFGRADEDGADASYHNKSKTVNVFPPTQHIHFIFVWLELKN